jgi:DNA polymerase III delta subunit
VSARAATPRRRGLKEEDLRRNLSDRAWIPPPVIYLWSDDHLLLRRAARSIARRAGGDSERALEHRWAADDDLGSLFGSARAPGLFDAPGERRVVYVHDADRVPPARQEGFLRELASVPDDVCLVLLARVREPDERRAPALHDKLLRAAGEAYLLYAPSGADLRRWLDGLAREKGLTLTEAARTRLLRVSGTSLAQIEGELEKLATVHASGAKIDASDLSAAAERGYRIAPADFSEAVGAGDFGGALRALHECERAGFSALDLVRDLAQYVEMLLAVREHLGPAPREGAVYTLTHAVWPRCVAAARHARTFEPKTLSAMLVALTGIERAEKTGREAAHEGLQNLLLGIFPPSRC